MKIGKTKSKEGLVSYFFGEYWSREGESSDSASGGHIDLWNKDTLTPNWASTLRFTLGIDSFNFFGLYTLSDLNKAKKILFFEVK